MFMIYLHEQNRHLSYLYGVIWYCDIRRNMHLIFGQLHWIAVKTLVSVISWVVLLLGEWGDLWTIPKSRNRLPEKKITKLEGRNLLSQPPELWKGRWNGGKWITNYFNHYAHIMKIPWKLKKTGSEIVLAKQKAFFLYCVACEILLPWPGIESVAVEGQILNLWTIREVATVLGPLSGTSPYGLFIWLVVCILQYPS